jgi:predicted Fe-Mo cluster-binding NifX family protein
MIILISALDPNFDAQMSPRFGRAPWFIRFDTETSDWQAIKNTGPDQPGGAGVATTQLLIDQSAKVVISGRFGPNAKQALQAAGIDMIPVDAEKLTVDEAIRQYQTERLTSDGQG